ncbi:MAG: hypothetical protein JWO56_3019, partial [Acidobacteria bacterium]|nr:hypothetical protein [Acidobacteriota bacterium]
MRREPALLLLLALFTFPRQAVAQQDPRSQETITVERILIDA